MGKKHRTYGIRETIFIITILLVSIFLVNNSQFLKALAQNNSSSDNKDNALPAQDNQSNLTAIFESLMNPKVLLSSDIDLIRNNTAKIGSSNNEAATANITIFVRNSGTLLLSHQIIPPKDFIPVYDSLPYKIMNGHVAAKLPCDSNSESPLQILVGQLSELKPTQLHLISGLSKPGYMCMYYADLSPSTNNTVATSKEPKIDSIMSSRGGGNLTITYIEFSNPTDYRVILPNTASLAISVNRIMPLENGTENRN
jgi:hypothetical protein